MEKIHIFDTTLRDGEQSPGVTLLKEEKLSIAKQLEKLKVDVIEAGFPIASLGDFEAVKHVANNVRGLEVCGLARTVQKDIDTAWEALKGAENPRIHVFIATSPIHMKYKLQMTPQQVLERAEAALKYAAQYTSNLEFSAEDASRSEIPFLVEIFNLAVKNGAKIINVPDTVGYALPEEFGQMIRKIREGIEDQAIISVHCHNDLGLAVANSLAAIENGARQIEVAVNGIGERAGNTALEEIVMALLTRKDFYQYNLVTDTTQIARLSKLVSSLTGMVVQPNKAIVGKNAFAHESGIHQDGVIKERTTYEIMDAKSIGLTENRMILGKHSGRNALRSYLRDLNYNIDEKTFEEIFARFKTLADKKKKLHPVEIEALIDDHLNTPEKAYELDYIHVSTSNVNQPQADIKLKAGDEIIEVNNCKGDGLVDAIYQAIIQAANIKNIELLSFQINAITEGKDALGEVIVKANIDGQKYIGRSSRADIALASALAFLDAINRYKFLNRTN